MVELTRQPCSVSAAASFARLLHVQRSGDVGSPRVTGVYERLERGENAGLVVLNPEPPRPRRPNAARRSFAADYLLASLSDSLARQTGGRRHQGVAAMPMAMDSAAAHRRRLRSSSTGATATYFATMVASSSAFRFTPRVCHKSPKIAI